MTFFEKITLIERVDQLIKLKGTGSSIELSSRLGISRSSLFELLDIMRSMGAEIDYCKHRKSYFYIEEKVLAIGFVSKEKIKGGKKYLINFIESDFFGLS
jgi:biotin operon repressor